MQQSRGFHTLTSKVFLISEGSFQSQKYMQQSRGFHTLTSKVFLISEGSFQSQKCMQQSRDLSYPHT